MREIIVYSNLGNSHFYPSWSDLRLPTCLSDAYTAFHNLFTRLAGFLGVNDISSNCNYG